MRYPPEAQTAFNPHRDALAAYCKSPYRQCSAHLHRTRPRPACGALSIRHYGFHNIHPTVSGSQFPNCGHTGSYNVVARIRAATSAGCTQLVTERAALRNHFFGCGVCCCSCSSFELHLHHFLLLPLGELGEVTPEDPAEQMSKTHEHQGIIAKSALRKCTSKSLILRTHGVLARHRIRWVPATASAGGNGPPSIAPFGEFVAAPCGAMVAQNYLTKEGYAIRCTNHIFLCGGTVSGSASKHPVSRSPKSGFEIPPFVPGAVLEPSRRRVTLGYGLTDAVAPTT